MPSPDSNMTLGDVISHTKRQFGDESGVQIVDSDIARWTNEAQREIVNKNPMIQATATQASLSGQQTYRMPSDLLQIESVFYDDNILQPKNFEGIRELLGIDNSQLGIPLYWYTWANQIYLWPIPNDIKVISVNYSAMPNIVSNPADKLGVPDRYYERVLEFVMSKAYELDEDWQGHSVQLQHFEDKLMEANNADKNMIGAFLVATDADYE